MYAVPVDLKTMDQGHVKRFQPAERHLILSNESLVQEAKMQMLSGLAQII